MKDFSSILKIKSILVFILHKFLKEDYFAVCIFARKGPNIAKTSYLSVVVIVLINSVKSPTNTQKNVVLLD